MSSKPEPPEDLWQRLSKELETTGVIRPANAFTRQEFQTKFGISKDKAVRIICGLISSKRVRRIQGPSTTVWYVFND